MSAMAQSRREVLEVGPLEILPDDHLARANVPCADALDP